MLANRIKENLNNPEELERLYRKDKKSFIVEFEQIYSNIANSPIAEFWNIRLNFNKAISKKIEQSKSDIWALIITCIIGGILIKLPKIFSIDSSQFLFYEKNAGMIVLFCLSIFIIWSNKQLSRQNSIYTFLGFLIPTLYINILPSDYNSHSINLAYIHLPLMLWCLFGLVFMNYDMRNRSKRIDFIKYNGDMAILGAIILIAGMLLAGITLGLFEVIEVNIENFYFEYIVIWGLVSAPIVAAYIIKNYSIITNKIAPIIAGIFSPLVLVTLIVYLITIIISGKDPYNDREFLLVFNLMLLGVMGIIVFSISEASENKNKKFSTKVLLLLTLVALIIDIIALSAIFYRIKEYGFSPNKTAVLGSNLLIFGNLSLIWVDLIRINLKNAELQKVETTIARYLPLYALWTLFVVFCFPLIFGYR